MVTAAPTQAKSQGHRSSGGDGTQRKKDTGEASLAASRARMLRVTNLTRNVDEEHLNEIFGTYARVESVHLAVDQENHLSKGYAYVLFATREGAEEAFFHVDKGQIDGNVVKVERSDSLAPDSLYFVRWFSSRLRAPLLRRLGHGRPQFPAAQAALETVAALLSSKAETSRVIIVGPVANHLRAPPRQCLDIPPTLSHDIGGGEVVPGHGHSRNSELGHLARIDGSIAIEVIDDRIIYLMFLLSAC
ncbi:hypothetical protein FOZ63_018326 [Perkinsus olseni]|uniref:RRM domain-containing protein n=1 Tax=Perkinsus olseni TaxID=32597 RepID=A0A7J6QTM0_PEROL|nr:hypothetical protein FOZ63_018326 [Perkinsus olseni]